MACLVIITAPFGSAAIPIVEEELQVGKREVQRGGVRVYSHANRLSYAQENNVTTGSAPFTVDWSRNFNYDPYGNMWVTNPTGITPAGNTPSPQSNFNASNNQLSASNSDAAGNQLMAVGYQITYDAENRLV